MSLNKTHLKPIAAAAAVILVLTLSIIPVSAASADTPALPLQIYGTVTDDSTSSPVAAGKTVIAYSGLTELGTYTISEPGKIGGPGIWDDKFLIQSESLQSGDTIYFVVDDVAVRQTVLYVPGASVEVKLIKPGDEFTLKANAVRAATSVRKLETPAQISTIPVPNYTNQKSGKSIRLNDSVEVTAVVGGVEKSLPAKIINNRVVLDDPTSATGATNITVKFVGQKLGDADGDGNVTVNDAVAVSQYLVSLVTLNEKGKFYGDPDGDGAVTVNDAVKVAQWLVHLIDDNYE